MWISRTGIIGSSISSYDIDAQAFITGAIITDNTQKTAINNLVIGFKSANIWNKMKAVYPFVGGTAAQHRFNLKDPRPLDAAFYLTFNGGGVHSATGYKPNGTNGYADTKLAPSVVQTLNSNGLGMYLGTLNTSTLTDPSHMGVFKTTSQASTLIINKANTTASSRLNGSLISSSTINALGMISTQRTSSTLTTLYKNATSVGSGNSGGSLASNSIFIGTSRGDVNTPYAQGYVNAEFRLAYISDGLTATDITNLYSLIQAYQTELSRQI